MAETKFHTETERKRWIGYYGNRYNKVIYTNSSYMMDNLHEDKT